MRLLVFVGTLLAMATTTASQADTYAYISLAGENKIGIYRMEPSTGRLTRTGELPTEGTPGALAVDPDRRYLFASLRSIQSLASYQIDAATGALTHINTIRVGVDAAYVGTDRTGRFLLSAYYAAGRAMVHAIGKDGRLAAEPLASVTTARNAHSSLPDPRNRFVFVPHTGPNAIFQFRFDAESGRLTPNEPPKVSTPDGTGPRHLRFHPTKPLAYVANEQGSSVTAYSLDADSGTLVAVQTLSTLPSEFSGPNTCAEVKVHPSGRWLWVSNRGHESLAGFALDAETGRMTALGTTPTEKEPRSFDLDPTGRYLYSAGQNSTRLAAYRIDTGTGRLERLDTYEVGKTPVWVLLVQAPGR